jgi:hypothetical protein
MALKELKKAESVVQQKKHLVVRSYHTGRIPWET